MRKYLIHIICYPLLAVCCFWGGALTRDYLVNKERIEDLARPARFLNKPAPVISTFTIDGKHWDLAEYRGKVVVLEFWSTWCPGCVSSIPHIKSLHAKFGHRSDFLLAGVALFKDPMVIRKFCDERDMPWEQLIEPKREWDNHAALALEVKHVPFTCVIGKDGVIRVYDFYSGDVGRLIERLLAEPNPDLSGPHS